MVRSSNRAIVIAAIAAAVASVALGIASLSGFGSSDAGDMVASPTPLSTVLLLLGMLALVELELSHMSRRRPARLARAAAEPARA